MATKQLAETKRVDSSSVRDVQVQPNTDIYEQFDRLDDQQIMEADSATREALVYRVKQQVDGRVVTRENLTWAGIKWLAIRMADRGDVLDVGEAKIELVKPDETKPSTWVYRATVSCVNRKNSYKTWGYASQSYHMGTRADTFADTKAISKAERNAIRKQIPEVMIQVMLTESRRAPKTPAGGAAAPKPEPEPVEVVEPEPEPEQVRVFGAPDTDTASSGIGDGKKKTGAEMIEQGNKIRKLLDEMSVHDKCGCRPPVADGAWDGEHADMLSAFKKCGTCKKIIA